MSQGKGKGTGRGVRSVIVYGDLLGIFQNLGMDRLHDVVSVPRYNPYYQLVELGPPKDVDMVR